MNAIRRETRLCPCCMEEHEVQSVVVQETNIFKGIDVHYKAEYNYCDRADEYFSDEAQLTTNDISMKDAYRKEKGLLTSCEIAAIRHSYGTSQTDLSLLLGWGAKTITRYEGHQVQDPAHDTILRKLSADPEWFLSLLQNCQFRIPATTYRKCYEKGFALFGNYHDQYRQRAIRAEEAYQLHLA